MASANYSKAVHHVLDIIHEVLHHQRQLENIWQHRKVRLHQRLQLCVFQQDVQQVRDAVRRKQNAATGTPPALWVSAGLVVQTAVGIHTHQFSRTHRSVSVASVDNVLGYPSHKRTVASC